ncbi:hypothetical protein [Rickettsiella endosymbiont of Aleochara curtula]|uniref:hypothetical protein n=1 Tax=Rickettsiella endosymbiont of Aleochara curtula TaxID=3077936 RepID=UPI00313C585E
MDFKYVENYISTIKAKYKSLQKANAYPFSLRIIDEEVCTKSGETLFTLQLVGKNLVSRLYAKDISNDKKLLKSLSPIDLLKILNTSNRKILHKMENVILFPCQAYYKLIAKNYNHILQQTIFTLEISRVNKITQKKLTALEIANNPLILEKLTPQEIYDLGYTVGSETILREILYLANL